ncbi:MAG: hypothetical protein ACOVN9_09735, partial [Inhella sp.]
MSYKGLPYGLTVLLSALVAANGLLFAWGQGWLGGQPGSTQREPARLAAQVNPERLKLLSPEAASAASRARSAASGLSLPWMRLKEL